MAKRMFQVLDEMNLMDIENPNLNNQNCKLAIYNQLVSAQNAKGGGHVTMGVELQTVLGLLTDKNKIPILIIVDREEYERLKM